MSNETARAAKAAHALRELYAAADKSEREMRRRNKERNAVMDAEEKFQRDNNIISSIPKYVRMKEDPILLGAFRRLFFELVGKLLGIVVFIGCWIAGIGILIWLIQSL